MTSRRALTDIERAVRAEENGAMTTRTARPRERNRGVSGGEQQAEPAEAE